MKKYIVRFDCCSGNLSVERHLHSYIREQFSNVIVSENAIQTIVQMITIEQEKYFLSHRGNSVSIRMSNNGMNSVKWITVGQMSITLIPVRNEIYI